jgi:hypothetical protein
MKPNVERVAMQIKARPWKSFLFGYLSYILAFLLLIALTISILGIPLAFLGVPLALAAAMVLSTTALSCILGERAIGGGELTFKTFLYGTLILAGLPGLLFFMQLITGSMVLMIFSWILIGVFIFLIVPIGLGAVLMTRFGTREAKAAPTPTSEPQLAPQPQRT